MDEAHKDLVGLSIDPPSISSSESEDYFNHKELAVKRALKKSRSSIPKAPRSSSPKLEMADRFPKIEDIDDAGLTSPSGNDGTSFLDRERALLGDDAKQFTTAQDATSNEDEKPTGGADDLIGGDDFGAAQQATSGDQDTRAFESAFPAVDTSNQAVGPGGTITGSQDRNPSYSAPTVPEDEPDPIKKWREKRDADNTRRAAASAEQKAAKRAEANKTLDAFYEGYNKKADKQREQSRREAAEFMAKRQDGTQGGATVWDRVGDLVDLNKKAEDPGQERMRQMLLGLRKDEKAPGAKGKWNGE